MQTIAFGPTIRLLRQAKGISLREMARRLGVSPAFLSQIEAGRQHKIPKARIVQVANMLGVSDAYLLGTARQIHPDVVEFLRDTPEAGEFMITAMRSGLAPEDFADLREALKNKTGKGFVRRANELYIRSLPDGAHEQGIGVRQFLQNLQEQFPHLRFGYFNPPKETFKNPNLS